MSSRSSSRRTGGRGRGHLDDSDPCPPSRRGAKVEHPVESGKQTGEPNWSQDVTLYRTQEFGHLAPSSSTVSAPARAADRAEETRSGELGRRRGSINPRTQNNKMNLK